MDEQEKIRAGNHATYSEAYTEYQAKRSRWRQVLRRYYLEAAAKWTKGPAIDFGCGVGELLKLLPAGSMGLEYNASTVQRCQTLGLPVHWYDGFADNFSLSTVPKAEGANTLFLSHVLEHFDDPVRVLVNLIQSSQPAVERVVVIVPGRAGFKIDKTHRTFVDAKTVESALTQLPGWRVKRRRFFPINLAKAGDFLAHNELQIVIDRDSA